MAREYKLRPAQIETVHAALSSWADHDSEDYADWQVQELVCSASQITIFIDECPNRHLLTGVNKLYGEPDGEQCRACRTLKQQGRL